MKEKELMSKEIKNILRRISPQKDVDCFHIDNIGKLFSGIPLYIPCTPNGIIKMTSNGSKNVGCSLLQNN